jgi:hypothetical protein
MYEGVIFHKARKVVQDEGRLSAAGRGVIDARKCVAMRQDGGVHTEEDKGLANPGERKTEDPVSLIARCLLSVRPCYKCAGVIGRAAFANVLSE